MEAAFNLAAALIAQHRFAEAEPLLLRMHQRLESRGLPATHRRVVIEPIVQLYEAWGKPDQAAEWRHRFPAATTNER